MNILNLTPHAVRILSPDGTEITTLPPSGEIARVSVTRVSGSPIAGLPVFHSSFGAVVGLPPAVEGTALVVSAMVRSACPARRDVFSPGELRRDAAGQPTGCVGLEGNL